MYKFRELPCSEKPRERLIQFGSAALSNSELLAIILGVGSRGLNVLELSRVLLQRYPLRELFGLGFNELISQRGLGIANACRIVACGEIFTRIGCSEVKPGEKVLTPAEAVALCPELQKKEIEHFVALYLNTRHRLIRKALISVGNVNSSIVDPMEVFKHALRCNAFALILLHNHPSGDPEPSQDDIKITHQLKMAGKLLNVQLLDHIIVGEKEFISLASRNEI